MSQHTSNIHLRQPHTHTRTNARAHRKKEHAAALAAAEKQHKAKLAAALAAQKKEHEQENVFFREKLGDAQVEIDALEKERRKLEQGCQEGNLVEQQMTHKLNMSLAHIIKRTSWLGAYRKLLKYMAVRAFIKRHRLRKSLASAHTMMTQLIDLILGHQKELARDKARKNGMSTHKDIEPQTEALSWKQQQAALVANNANVSAEKTFEHFLDLGSIISVWLGACKRREHHWYKTSKVHMTRNTELANALTQARADAGAQTELMEALRLTIAEQQGALNKANSCTCLCVNDCERKALVRDPSYRPRVTFTGREEGQTPPLPLGQLVDEAKSNSSSAGDRSKRFSSHTRFPSSLSNMTARMDPLVANVQDNTIPASSRREYRTQHTEVESFLQEAKRRQPKHEKVYRELSRSLNLPVDAPTHARMPKSRQAAELSTASNGGKAVDMRELYIRAMESYELEKKIRVLSVGLHTAKQSLANMKLQYDHLKKHGRRGEAGPPPSWSSLPTVGPHATALYHIEAAAAIAAGYESASVTEDDMARCVCSVGVVQLLQSNVELTRYVEL